MRRLALVAALISGCGGSSNASPTTSPPEAIGPRSLDDKAAIARVHAFFAAFDANDPDAFRATTTDGFFMFQFGFAIPKERFLKSQRLPRTRTCESESVRRTGGTIVYTGDCTEHKPAEGEDPPAEFRGWSTVVMVARGNSWKVALWQWTYGGIEQEKAHWNMRYRTGTGFTKAPNRFLATRVADIAPGKALVLAMGQGRNAVFLASKGWEVTGVDMADEGVRQAELAASDAGLRLDAVLADIDEYEFGTQKWDLVTMIYAGASVEWMERIRTSMRPGGMFVLEYFERPSESDDPDQGVSREDLARAFAGWELLVNESVEGVADWGNRKAPLVRFAARKPKS